MIGATASAALATIESLVTSGSAVGQAANGSSTAAPTAVAGSAGGVQATSGADTIQDSISISEEALGMFAASADGTTMSLGLSSTTVTESDGSTGTLQTNQFSLHLSVGNATPANAPMDASTGAGQAQQSLGIWVDGASGKVMYQLPTDAPPGSAAAAKEQTTIGDALATAMADAKAGAFSIFIGSSMVQSGSSGASESSDGLAISMNAQGELQAASSHMSEQVSNGVLTSQTDVSMLSVSNEQGNQVISSTVEDQTIVAAEASGGGLSLMSYQDETASLRIGDLAGGTAAADSGSSGAAAALASLSAFETARRAEEKAPPSALDGIAATINAVA